MKNLLFFMFLLPLVLCAGSLDLQLNFAEDGDCGFVSAPQRSRVPVHTVNVLLPSGSKVLDYTFSFAPGRMAEKSFEELNGPWVSSAGILDSQPRRGNSSGYSYLGLRHWGDLCFASFMVLPYDSAGGIWHDSAKLSISYRSAPEARNIIPSTFSKASFFVNSASLHQWYNASQNRNYDFLVIGTPELYNELSAWQSFRQSQGLSVQYADINSILANEVGANDAEKMRNYLITEYALHPFTYLMIVGDYDTVPVAYLTPEPDGVETIPSDFYYCDLSSNWDTDSDGRYGEYYAQSGEQDWQVDYTPEIFVGRLSTNNPAEINTIANRIVAFESSDDPYKQRALMPAAFLNYMDEPDPGLPQTDGAEYVELAINTVLRAYDCDTMYEQEGVVPSYPSDYPLDETNFNSLLRGTDYGIINWSAHGSSTSSSRKVWMEDSNGNSIPEYWEMTWMGLVEKQSFNGITVSGGSVIFAASCYNGLIDDDESSLAEFALIKKGVGVVGATRTGWYKPGWINPGWGGLSSYNYHFLENYAEAGYSLGAAHAYANLLHTQYYLFGDPLDSGGIIWPELQNVYTYLLYGDPAVGHNPMPAPEGEILVYIPAGDVDYRLINSIREESGMNVIYSNRLIPDYDYIADFEAVFCIMDTYELADWEKDILVDYLDAGGKLYMEGDISWDSSDPLLGKFEVEEPLDIAISIHSIHYPQKSWDYEDEGFSYTVLVPTPEGGATPILFANTMEDSPYCIGTVNSADGYHALAAEFHLQLVVDEAGDYDSYSALVQTILIELDLLSGGSANGDAHSPEAIVQLSAWPNPALDNINICAINGAKGSYELDIYNIRGQKVNSLLLDAKNGYQTIWNGRDKSGTSCPAGIYLIKSGGLSKKLTLIK